MSAHIHRVLRETAPFTDGPITSTTNLTSDLGYDSLGLWELVFLLEETFQLNASDGELLEVSTVADIETLVWAKLSATTATSDVR